MPRSPKKPDAEPLAAWRNRIVDHGEASPVELVEHPSNWRVHSRYQQDAMRSVLNEIGWVRDVVVNRRTGRIVDGHMRVTLAVQQGEPAVPVSYIDVDEQEEALILAVLDPLGALATTDGKALDALLQGVQSDDGGINALLEELTREADATQLRAPDGTKPRNAGFADPKSLVKAVLFMEEVAVFEEAIRLTGETNRGRALLAVCREYVRSRA